MHSCFTSSIFAARTLDFKVKFGFVFRSEAVVFRRYVLVLLSVGLLRKFEAYLVYLSLSRSYFLRCFSFFQKFLHFSFALSSPVFPRKLMTCAVVFQLCALLLIWRDISSCFKFRERAKDMGMWFLEEGTGSSQLKKTGL